MSKLLTIKQFKAREHVSELAFRRRLARAAHLSDFVIHHTEALPNLPSYASLSPRHFPAFTLRRLEMTARIEFHAGATLLRERWLSYAAEVHGRTLLELYAHVGWIAGLAEPSRDASPSNRAVCLELGWARAMEAFESGQVAAGVQSPHLTAPLVSTQVRELVERVYKEAGCRGKARRPDASAASLKRLSTSQGPWFVGLYDLFSRITHQQVLDRMLRATSAQGDVNFGYAIFGQRAQTLTLLVNLYGQVGVWTLNLLGYSASASSLFTEAESLVNDRWLTKAREGSIDFNLGYMRSAHQ